MSESDRIFVALGSNLGDRGAHLAAARKRLGEVEGIHVVAVSRIYETAPVGPPGQGAYLNAAVELRSAKAPRALLAHLLEIERAEGRDREAESARWGPRTLDLDLLLVGDQRIETPGLTLPHPRLHERAFVLAPLCELAPDVVHPVLGEPLERLAARHRNDADVRPWQGEGDWPGA